MSDRIVDFVILAEDLRTANFLRRYAKKIVHPRRIRLTVCPVGRQAGEQFVRENYAKEVQEQRHAIRASIKNAALLVHVDADAGTVQGEHQQLAEALRKAGQTARAALEKIAIAVPKRHTETWIHGLCGDIVDELYNYKRDPDGKIAANQEKLDKMVGQRSKPAAGELYKLTRRNAPKPPAAMPSLAAAIPELRRLEM